MPVPRPWVHPLRIAIVRAGWPSNAAFARYIGTDPANLTSVLTGRLASWPKLRRQCSEALGTPKVSCSGKVAEEWITENPAWANDVRPLIEERTRSRIERAQTALADSMFGSIHKPVELGHLSEANIESLTQG